MLVSFQSNSRMSSLLSCKAILPYNAYQSLLYGYIEHLQCSSRYSLKQAHICFLASLLISVRCTVQILHISNVKSLLLSTSKSKSSLCDHFRKVFLDTVFHFEAILKWFYLSKKLSFIIYEINFEMKYWKVSCFE